MYIVKVHSVCLYMHLYVHSVCWLCAQALQQPQSAHTAHSPTLVESCVVLTWIYSTLGESPFCKSLLSQIVLSRVKGNKVLKHNFCNKFQEFNHFLDKVVVHARVFVTISVTAKTAGFGAGYEIGENSQKILHKRYCLQAMWEQRRFLLDTIR